MASKQNSTETPVAEPVAEPIAEPVPDTVSALDMLDNPIEHTETPEIDQRIKNFVDAGEKLTIAKPRKWHFVKLPSAEEAQKIAKDAKTHARATGRVFRVKKSSNPAYLVYRVVAKIERDAAEAAKTDAAE